MVGSESEDKIIISCQIDLHSKYVSIILSHVGLTYSKVTK